MDKKYKCSSVGIDSIRDMIRVKLDTTKQEETSLYLIKLNGIPFSEAIERLTWGIQEGKESLIDKEFGKVYTVWVNYDNIPDITIDTESFINHEQTTI